ncbi:unnamed protein product [Cuscuta europaea]|uniref:Uncharacterized protein n=1 Tax=Cuscuta europaea TaxID=41803 RepID=A0A9P1EK08_CUSEU|nr:unnamed protein product [Cuscuta europaea]
MCYSSYQVDLLGWNPGPYHGITANDPHIIIFFFGYLPFLILMANPPPSTELESSSEHISHQIHVPNTSEPINLDNVIKLSPTKYISWQLQIESILTGYNLEGFLDGSHPCPPPSLIVDGASTPNPAFSSWVRQDKLLFGAIIGTLTQLWFLSLLGPAPPKRFGTHLHLFMLNLPVVISNN